VNEIIKLTGGGSWRHCPGKENPADLPSRGLTPLELSASALWRHGPLWMTESDAPDPDPHPHINLIDMPEDCAQEMKGTSKATAHTLLNQSPTASIGAIMRCQEFSSLPKLL